MDLGLEADAKAILEDPLRQGRGVEPRLDLVRRGHGREEDGPGGDRLAREDVPRELVVLPVREDELHLILRPEVAEVLEGDPRLHPGARALHVHDVPHEPRFPLCGHRVIEGGEVDLAIRLKRVDDVAG